MARALFGGGGGGGGGGARVSFLEVLCKGCGEVRRFASGTDAGFAVYLINSKLGLGVPAALYIEAAKDGEEPINFGPKAALVNYGECWRLQTVIEEVMKEGFETGSQKQQISMQISSLMKPSESGYIGKPADAKPSESRYIGKPADAKPSESRYIGKPADAKPSESRYIEKPADAKPSESRYIGKPADAVSPITNCQYFVKMLIAFVLMYLFGRVLVFFLENLPRLMQLINSF